MSNKRIIWLFSTGLFALLPFLIKYLFKIIFSIHLDLNDFFKTGELFAINTVICFGCLIDLFLHKEESIDVRRGYFSTMLLLVGLLSSLMYGALVLTGNSVSELKPNIGIIVNIQIILYVLTLIFGSFSRQFV